VDGFRKRQTLVPKATNFGSESDKLIGEDSWFPIRQILSGLQEVVDGVPDQTKMD
jgi:hypothetical protein